MSTYEYACSAAGKTSFAAVFHEDGHQTAARPQKADLVSRIVAAVVGSIARWYRFRRTIGELRRIDGRMLRDIGLERDQIESVVCAMTVRDTQVRLRD
jgi:uncharacterized protein YjiS (DUF1127 family)